MVSDYGIVKDLHTRNMKMQDATCQNVIILKHFVQFIKYTHVHVCTLTYSLTTH